MKKIIFKLSALSIILIATSCKKGDTGPAGAAGTAGATGATGPSLSGSMEGFVSLYDAAGSKILSNLKGDTLLLTNNSTNAVTKTTTDSTGKYMFANLTTGNYNLTTTKMGYGTLLAQNIQFVGGGNTYKNGALCQIPTTNVTSAQAVDTAIAATGSSTTSTSENYIKVRGTLPAAVGGSEVIVFVSNVGGTSASGSVTNFSTYYTLAVAPGALTFKINIPTSDLYDLGFVTGNTVYFAAYLVGGNLNASSYVDLTTGKNVFTALSNAPINTSALVQ